MTTGPKPSQFRQESALTGHKIVWNGSIWTPGSRDNISASSNPTVNDDNTQGYSVGSIWVNTSTDTYFVAVDVSTGAAVWNEEGGGTSSIWIITPVIDNGDSPYIPVIFELVQVDASSGDVTINFPVVSSANEGRHIGVKVTPTSSPVYDVDLVPNGSNTIEETKGFTLDWASQWAIFVADGIDNWIQIG